MNYPLCVGNYMNSCIRQDIDSLQQRQKGYFQDECKNSNGSISAPEARFRWISVKPTGRMTYSTGM